MAVVSIEKKSNVDDDDKKIIGECESILGLKKIICKVAKTSVTVVLEGETGTGKELFAELIHRKSKRKDKPFLPINCGAIAKDLLETELFGHEKGAFTGASQWKKGKFEMADEGTIFLDEIESMPPAMQVALLRVLQDGIFFRVGGNSPVKTNVRIIVATKKNLFSLVQKGKFRDDLFYRLNVISLKIPPLRNRGDDILILTEYFLNKYSEKHSKKLKFSISDMLKLKSYNWPGNVRELESTIERAVILSDKDEITVNDFIFEELIEMVNNFDYPEEIKEIKKIFKKNLSLKEAINLFKKIFIIFHLKKNNGNRAYVAKKLDIHKAYLSSLITKYNIKIPSIYKK